MATGGRFRELLKKYGKVALGVHCSVSAASVAGLYVAVKSNVDVESLIDRLPNLNPFKSEENPASSGIGEEKKRNRTAELAASSGGAIALAVLCNKALFPIRVPITLAVTPPLAKFLARRKLIKTGL
ncbi:uncharacterized protein LOC126782129 [Argentina anserina]|uniref:uncharacterized protein LOC126782129 n=1 Tax=Argentina anserina TaxID=57926 RepID=UPI0021765056|nr:uncharacterized protein LOC126782129 [Potentilla anserina]XP_050363261.1 uncharacterized protein LOC126782129 [Potentilla anserina]